MSRAGPRRIRIATYNVHKCRGLDGRLRPERIAQVLKELDADIVALQEVLSIPNGARCDDQARFLSEELGLEFCQGPNRRMRGGIYGNVVLSRFPLRDVCNYDISVRGRERRGCLRTDVEVGQEGLIHVFNVHLGTAFLERRQQGRRLIDPEILNNHKLTGARIVLGDFNEWTRGLTSRLLTSQLKSVDIRVHLRRSSTYPGVFPLLHLDHIYFDGPLELDGLKVPRTRTALVASDHLPLVADFSLLRR